MNKQKAEKKNHAFLTGMVNMLVEANIGNAPCNYDPRSLTTMTHNAMPLRTLSRRVDGAFPSVINPIAIWEIKEYYYTTTFGSRVADGVYETLLDGMELEELETAAQRKVQHILFIDDHFTWWECGHSYLCRIIVTKPHPFYEFFNAGRYAAGAVQSSDAINRNNRPRFGVAHVEGDGFQTTVATKEKKIWVFPAVVFISPELDSKGDIEQLKPEWFKRQFAFAAV